MNIDKEKEYTFGNYTYVNFTQLSRDELVTILKWRNHPDIRMCMNTTEPIPLEGHLAFCESLKNREDKFYWMIKKVIPQ